MFFSPNDQLMFRKSLSIHDKKRNSKLSIHAEEVIEEEEDDEND